MFNLTSYIRSLGGNLNVQNGQVQAGSTVTLYPTDLTAVSGSPQVSALNIPSGLTLTMQGFDAGTNALNVALTSSSTTRVAIIAGAMNFQNNAGSSSAVKLNVTASGTGNTTALQCKRNLKCGSGLASNYCRRKWNRRRYSNVR